MSDVSFRFLLVAVAAALIGMSGGILMAIAQDFSLAPAHAHLNLLGWVTMALYGLFYRAVPEAAHGMLPRVHFWLATCGVTLMIPGIAWVVLGHADGERIIAPGALMVVCGMIVFGIVVVRSRTAPWQQRAPLAA
jgi:cbb3-type cytochrome oxidase subunit 1